MANDDNDFFSFADEDEPITTGSSESEHPEANLSGWPILIVDDDPSVLTVTDYALRKLVVDGRPIELHTAKSMAEAQALLETNQDYAVLVTDVVMETDHAGLDLIAWIRKQRALGSMRLVVRSGQPGAAPQEEVVKSLDINDYWSKTETTPGRIRTMLTGLIRSYRDISALQDDRAEYGSHCADLGLRYRYESLAQALEATLLQLNLLDATGEVDFPNRRGVVAQNPYTFPLDPKHFVQYDTHRFTNDLRCLVEPFLERKQTENALNIKFSLACAFTTQLNCHVNELLVGIFELIKNAVEAMRGPGNVTVETKCHPDRFELIIRDEGVGMTLSTLSRCKDPFFTTKGEKSTGLGLYLASHVIKAHNGTLTIESTPALGTTATVTLPLANSAD